MMTYHECRKVVLMLLCLCSEVLEVQVAICQCFNRNHFQTCHYSGLLKLSVCVLAVD